MNETEIAIVGGGPAGAALAIQLARAGREVTVFERLASPRWRASGVYTSPLTRRRLLALGLHAGDVARLIRPISAMVVRTVDGDSACRLEYPAPGHACGIDRVRLERSLLNHARRLGADVREGWPVRSVDLGSGRPGLIASGPDGPTSWRARLVVGADGPSSLVARSAGVALPTRRFRRAALTVHHRDPSAAAPRVAMEAEMLVGPGWYCGIAPVPRRRVNIGLVMGESTLRRQLLLPGGASAIIGRMLTATDGPRHPSLGAPATDELQVALPLAHRVRRSAGPGFLLVGDASGFVDPLSGEGLQRAFAAAQLAATAITAWCAGEQGALEAYDQRLRARFTSKDVLSWLLQGFLFNPVLTSYALRNLERRPDLRQTFGQALADMLPASRVLDPRFLARLFAPSG